MVAKVRVLTVISGLAIGGAERFAIELACSLDRAVFEPLVCALWRRGDPAEAYWAQRLAEAGITVLFAADWPGRADPRRYVQGLRNVAMHFHHAPVDVAHSHLPLAGLAILLTRRALRAKIIVRTAHAGKEWGDGTLASICRQIFTRCVFPLAFDAEVCVSQSLVDVFNHSPENAALITNAIHTDGSGIAAVLPYEMAEQKGVEVTQMARGHGFPLVIKLEPDE